MSREKKGYSLKKERGLVPFLYNTKSESFLAGAHKNWPRETSLNPRMRQRIAMAETPSNNGYTRGHCFVY